MNNWKDFNPFNKDTPNMNDFSIENYIKQVLSQSMPSSLLPNLFNESEKNDGNDHKENNYKQRRNYQVFELHYFVIVRIEIEPHIDVNDLKIYHTSNQLILEGLPDKNGKKVIPLPAVVHHKGTKAIFKDHILEISIPKGKDNRLTQIDVQKS